jgi:hypothetical protein
VAQLYLDNDVSVALIHQLGVRGHAVTATRDLSQQRAPDDLQLLRAAEHRWTLISHNRRDFLLLHRAWRRWSDRWGVTAMHAGILIIPHGSSVRLAEAIHEFLELALSLDNQLHKWHPLSGWRRYD